jgi:hypothetical protein
MRGAIPALPQYTSMEWCLVKHRESFTFLPLKLVTNMKDDAVKGGTDYLNKTSQKQLKISFFSK